MYKLTYIDYQNREVILTFSHYYKLAAFMEGIPFHRIVYFGIVEPSALNSGEIDSRD